ncbi:MAG: Ldh family oxidoreductase [candidate division Zixibacteria bacterium]|nr:Ldh family oxidoreductase [candidate division Zixibacteria bacterium]
MNVPPKIFIRVMHDDLRDLCVHVLVKTTLSRRDAQRVAELMVDTDLRGVFSHGSQTLGGYARAYRSGAFNPSAQPHVVKDTAVIALIDGDGGVGHLATQMATEMAIRKARSTGLSLVVTRNHGHFGSAGKYVRMAVKEGLVGFCVSGIIARPVRDPNDNTWVHYPLDNPPMSFGFPARTGYPVILDMCSSVVDEWDVESDRFKSIFAQMPAAVFRSFGLRAATDFLSAALGGMMMPGFRDRERKHAGAYYGASIWVIDPGMFTDTEAFKDEVDRTTALIRTMKPLPGYDRADLPSGPEWDREREYAQTGIPIGEGHRQALESIADELGVPIPWRT